MSTNNDGTNASANAANAANDSAKGVVEEQEDVVNNTLKDESKRVLADALQNAPDARSRAKIELEKVLPTVEKAQKSDYYKQSYIQGYYDGFEKVFADEYEKSYETVMNLDRAKGLADDVARVEAEGKEEDAVAAEVQDVDETNTEANAKDNVEAEQQGGRRKRRPAIDFLKYGRRIAKKAQLR